jgi:hypothetical protein
MATATERLQVGTAVAIAFGRSPLTGDFYTHTLMPPFFRPAPNDFGPPPGGQRDLGHPLADGGKEHRRRRRIGRAGTAC